MPLQWFKLLFKWLNVGISIETGETWHLNFWSIKLRCVVCTHQNGKLVMLVFSSILNSQLLPLWFINDGSVFLKLCNTCLSISACMCLSVCWYVSKILIQQWIHSMRTEPNRTNNDYDDYSVIFFALFEQRTAHALDNKLFNALLNPNPISHQLLFSTYSTIIPGKLVGNVEPST